MNVHVYLVDRPLNKVVDQTNLCLILHCLEKIFFLLQDKITLMNKTLGRARDPRANGTWLSKLTERNTKCLSLGGQRIDQKSKKGWKRG